VSAQHEGGQARVDPADINSLALMLRYASDEANELRLDFLKYLIDLAVTEANALAAAAEQERAGQPAAPDAKEKDQWPRNLLVRK
jgi:hypothetical protein